jgi:hypothetical protein
MGMGKWPWVFLFACATFSIASVSVSLVDVTKKLKVSNPSSLLSIQTALDQATQYNQSLLEQMGQIDTFKDCKCRTDGTVFLNSFDLGTKERQSKVACEISTATLLVFANDLDAHFPNISVSQGLAMGFLGNNNTSDNPPKHPVLYPLESSTVNILTSDLKRGSWNSNVDVSGGTIQAQVVHATQLLDVSGRLSAPVLYITKPEGGTAATFSKNNYDCTQIDAMGPVTIVSPYVTSQTHLCYTSSSTGSYTNIGSLPHSSTATWGWTDYSGPTAAPWTRKTSAGTYGSNTLVWRDSAVSGPDNYGPSIKFYTSEANGGSFNHAVVPTVAVADGYYVMQWELWFGSISFQSPSVVSHACKSQMQSMYFECLSSSWLPFCKFVHGQYTFIKDVLDALPDECSDFKSSSWPLTLALDYGDRNYYPTVWAKWLTDTVSFGKWPTSVTGWTQSHRTPPTGTSLAACGTTGLDVGDKCILSNGASYIWDGSSWKPWFKSSCPGTDCKNEVPGTMCAPDTNNPSGSHTETSFDASMVMPTEVLKSANLDDKFQMKAYVWWVCSLEKKWTPLPFLTMNMEASLF